MEVPPRTDSEEVDNGLETERRYDGDEIQAPVLVTSALRSRVYEECTYRDTLVDGET